jgi:hypothetical protein
MSRPWTRHAAALLLGAACYFLQGPSLVWHPFDRLRDNRDALLNAWIMAWDAHALTRPGVSVWDAPIHYPARRMLSWSETMFGTLAYSVPVNLLGGNMVLAAHAHIFLAFVLCFFTTFVLVRSLTGSFLAGLVAGFVFSFNPLRWDQVSHMNLLPFFFAPLALLCCERFLRSEQFRPFLGMVLCLAGQYWMSFNLGTVLLTTLIIYTALHCLAERTGRERFFLVIRPRMWAFLAAGAAVGAACLLPVALPCFRTLHDWQLLRTQADNAASSCEPLGFIKPCDMFASYQWTRAYLPAPLRGEGWLGAAPWLLAAAALVFVRPRHGATPEARRLVLRFAALAAVAAVLMLGPQLIWLNHGLRVPLPYLLVYYGVPGAGGMRTPYRYFLPLLLSLSVLAGFAVAHAERAWRARHPGRFAFCVLGLAGLLAVDYAARDEPGVALPSPGQFPPVYAYLARGDPGRPVLELPARWNRQFEYQLYQTSHWRPLVNGETGSLPPAGAQLIERAAGPPDERMLRFLRLTPAQTVVLHLAQFDSADAAAWRTVKPEDHGFRCAAEFGDDLVWERDAPPPETSANLRVVRADAAHNYRLWRDRLDLTLEAAPAEPDKAWRYLTRGVQEVDITVTDGAGRVTRRTVSCDVPPYCLSDERATVKLGPVAGWPAGPARVRVEGPLLEPFEITLGE